ncbi:MAG: PIN domain nuclease [Chitinispirillaceae bacterium]|nr:PIN domain nuclease [Chitinispirillaceae bacterium]
MVMVDTSAWIEFFRNSASPVVHQVDTCLEKNLVGIGDLIFCEIIQGIKQEQERDRVSSLLLSLPQYDMVGFRIAEKAADNYRLLQSKGLTIRKTIDVIIGTFCAENGFTLIHNDRDFVTMASAINLITYTTLPKTAKK